MKFHPLFLVVAVYFIVQEKALLFAGYLAAILVHEYAHYIVAKSLGYQVGQVTIMPYGGRMSGYTYNSFYDGIIIAMAGPIANVIFALIVMAFWSIIDNVKNYTIDIVRSSFYLALINLLPIFPLDGSQIIFLLSKQKIKSAIVLKWISIIVGVIFVALSVVSMFYIKNITLSIFGIFIVISTIFSKDKILYEYFSIKGIKKKQGECYKLTKIVVEKDMTLSKLLAQIGKKDIKEFYIKGLDVTLSEEEVVELGMRCCISDSIGKLVNPK